MTFGLFLVAISRNEASFRLKSRCFPGVGYRRLFVGSLVRRAGQADCGKVGTFRRKITAHSGGSWWRRRASLLFQSGVTSRPGEITCQLVAVCIAAAAAQFAPAARQSAPARSIPAQANHIFSGIIFRCLRGPVSHALSR